MAVVADRVGVGDLAEVHRVVLVAQDRVHDLPRLPCQLGQRRRIGELVLDRYQRHVEARRSVDSPPPDAGGDDDVLGTDRSARGLHAHRATALDQQSGDLAVAEGLDRPHGGTAPARRARPWRSRRRPPGGRRRWCRDPAAERLGDLGARAAAPRGRSHAPVPSGGRARPSARRWWRPRCSRPGGRLRAPELLGRPLCQARHRPRRVVLEDQPRSVRRRAAGLEQRPLVDDHDLVPAALGEVVCDAGAGDAGPDHDDAGGLGRRGHLAS